MARITIDYGIDLGTTNSAICRMENGAPVVKKIEVIDDIMPSCVCFNKRGSIVVGRNAYNSLKSDKRRATKTWSEESTNTYVEFKRRMGTDTSYHSEYMAAKGFKADYSPEELSAEVLRALTSYITDESVRSAVITVPAKFTVGQKTATIEAGRLAGLAHVELLQEPIAASMAFGLSSAEKDGMWLVFDFGGGTFDAALVRVEDGILQVFDTEGDNYLGGQNLDLAIVDKIFIPYLEANYSLEGILGDSRKREILRQAMKTFAEPVKNDLSFQAKVDVISDIVELGPDDDGEDIELDLTISREQAEEAMRPIFQKAVDICKGLLRRNNIAGAGLTKLILVGGPTHTPLVRQMLREQITPNVDTSIDPMTAVASGAALYAATISAEICKEDVETGMIHLDLGYETTTVETSVWVSIKFDNKATGAGCPNSVAVELVRADKGWASGKVSVTTEGDVIEVNLKEGRPNTFAVMAYDTLGTRLQCFPDQITIIQGTKVGAAPLSYNIGIEVWDEEKKKLVFEPVKGLEKNKPLPATGVRNDLRTTQPLRPGQKDDKLIVPLYQADYQDGGRVSSKLYEYLSEVVIDGTEVGLFLPEGASVELTIHADTSEQMTLEVYFPDTDITIKKELNTGGKASMEQAAQVVEENFTEAGRLLTQLERAGINVSDLREKLDDVRDNSQTNTDKKDVLKHQRDVMREIEARENGSEFDRLVNRLKGLLEETKSDQNKYGDFQTGKMLDQLRASADEAVAKKDVKMAKDVLEQVEQLDYRLALVEYYIAWIAGWQRRFDSLAWSDRTRARQLINQAIPLINDAPTAEKLQPYVRQLIDLLPRNADRDMPRGRLTRQD